MNIEVQNLQKAIPLKPSQINAITRKVLKLLKIKQADLSIALVNDRKMRSLNKKFLGRDHATDVLAFNYGKCQGKYDVVPKMRTSSLHGEIIVSVETALRNARRYQNSPSRELTLYLIHGILHLLNYDDHSYLERERMSAREEEILQQIKFLGSGKG